jgi:pyroglutamyl-peptidase
MTNRLRILITGFQAFPGAPFNPTPRLVERLMQLRRPALADVERIAHIFPVTYAAVDAQLPDLIARHRPDALLMFGLAARTPFLRIETRARNAITTLWPDDEGRRAKRLDKIAPGGAAATLFGPHTTQLLKAAQDSGVWAVSSRDAGRYLCNYLSWRAIECVAHNGGPRLAAFIHVPLVPRDAAHARSRQRHVTFEQMVDAGEAILMETIRQTRRVPE